MLSVARPLKLPDPTGARPLTVRAGRIEFNGVNFGYGREIGLLQDFNLVIRPGEKIHECLMTSDESMSALESWDRYVIIPDVLSNVTPGFAYTSDQNEKWLSIEEIRNSL